MVTEKIILRKVDANAKITKITSSDSIDNKDKIDVMNFIKDLRLGKITGRPVKDSSLEGYLSHLYKFLDFNTKPVIELTEQDIDMFWDALLRDKIKNIRLNKNGGVASSKPYSDTQKKKYKTTALMYLEWRLEEQAFSITKSLRAKFRVQQKTHNFLTEEEILKLYRACKTTKHRYLISMLFDSGARRTAFYNIRKSDIELPSGDRRYPLVTLRKEFNKTEGRTIPLMWKHTNKALQEYLLERIEEGIKPEDPVFDWKVNKLKSIQMFLQRLGKKVLKKNINFHIFRHSSATYYSAKYRGARDKLCIRYGWKFSSPMPDLYIDRSGARDLEFEEKMVATDLDELRGELEEYKNLSKIKDDEIKNIKIKLNEVIIHNTKEMKQVRAILKLLQKK